MGTEEEKSLLGSSSWLCKSPVHCFAFTQSSWEEEEEEEEEEAEAEAEDISDAVLVKRLESSAISVACYESWREQLSDSPSQNMRQDDGEVGLDNFCPLSQGYQKLEDAAGHVSLDVNSEDCVPVANFAAGDVVYDANSTPSANFLGTCSFCHNVLLQGRDIYMYRGDCAFCSEECRHRQILLDEMNDRCSSAAAYYSGFSSCQSKALASAWGTSA